MTEITPQTKRFHKKEKYLKAKINYEKFLEKRKIELGTLLLKIDERLGDYEDVTLKPYFEKIAKEISHDNENTPRD